MEPLRGLVESHIPFYAISLRTLESLIERGLPKESGNAWRLDFNAAKPCTFPGNRTPSQFSGKCVSVFISLLEFPARTPLRLASAQMGCHHLLLEMGAIIHRESRSDWLTYPALGKMDQTDGRR
jgi:hypothetical protein